MARSEACRQLEQDVTIIPDGDAGA